MKRKKEREHPPLVGFDTMMLIYAFRDKPCSVEGAKHTRLAKSLVQELTISGSRICISIITVAEYLVKVEASRRHQMLQFFEKQFEIAPFNLQAAQITADLVPFAKTLVNLDRPVVMADTKIAGSLIARRCPVIYTADEKFKKIALSHPRCPLMRDCGGVQLHLDFAETSAVNDEGKTPTSGEQDPSLLP